MEHVLGGHTERKGGDETNNGHDRKNSSRAEKKMEGGRNRVMEVLNVAYAGAVVDKRVASTAIREFEALLADLHNRPAQQDLVTVPRRELDNMKQVILYQEEKIRNLKDRNEGVHKDEGPLYRRNVPTDRHGSDRDRRLKLADQFHSLYDNEWKTAFTELKLTMRWRDADCIYVLMRVIRKACDLCIDLADDQMDKLLVDMEHCMVDPMDRHGGQYKQISKKTEERSRSEGIHTTEKYANQYRAERAEASVPAVIDMFMDSNLGTIINPRQVRPEFRRYVERCVELTWLMTTLDPPMRLFWLHQSDRVNTELFKFYDRRGEYVNQMVFPAIFLRNSGILQYRGYVLAE